MKREKLFIDITGPDGNIYFILAKVQMIMKRQKRINEFNELREKIYNGSYYQALYRINKKIELIDTSRDQVLQNYLDRGEKECLEADNA